MFLFLLFLRVKLNHTSSVPREIGNIKSALGAYMIISRGVAGAGCFLGKHTTAWRAHGWCCGSDRGSQVLRGMLAEDFVNGFGFWWWRLALKRGALDAGAGSKPHTGD